ncbi:hypothetical protein C8F01DRAFT_1264294 [Mycena amicta]|nr:hypothetical protein C8F01DRAFT_1264294 [Mycena amicta]
MLHQKSITEFFSQRKTSSSAAATPAVPQSSPSPAASLSPSQSVEELVPVVDKFPDDELLHAGELRHDYIRYDQRGTNGILEWTFRLARQRGQGDTPKECAWCFVSLADATVLYKCSLDEACLKGLFACRSCILIAHKHHPEHGFIDFEAKMARWIKLRRISDLGYVFQEGHKTMFGGCRNPAPTMKRKIHPSRWGNFWLTSRACHCPRPSVSYDIACMYASNNT